MTRRRSKNTERRGAAPAPAPASPPRSESPASSPAAAPAAQPVSRNIDPVLRTLQQLAARTTTLAVALVLAFGFFVVITIFAARTATPTADEFVYVPAGLYHLRTGDLSFDPTNPPLLKMAMALPLAGMGLDLDLSPKARDNSQGWGPWVFGTSFMERNRERYLDAFFAARLVIIALGIGLGALVFVRARELVSPAAAIVALVLYATMPPVLAHSAVATLDLGVSLAVFAALYAASRFASTKEWGWAVLAGAAMGFGFAIKGTTALFAPLVPVLVAAEWRNWNNAGTRWFAAGGAIMLASAWIAILVSYGFSGFPLPAPLVEGLRFQINASSAGEYPAFLAGSWSPTGWWYYYLAALVWKTPLATLLLLVAGVFEIVRGARAANAGRFAADDGTPAELQPRGERLAQNLWIVLPPLFLVYLLSFHYAKDYGIRYLLPAFPFFVLLAARGADLLLRNGKAGRMALGVLLAWQIGAAAITGPHQLAYFNELAGGTDRARHLLLDSNLDWGQDLGRLADWLRDRGLARACIGYFGHVSPKVYGIDLTFPPAAPAPGLCAISANFLGGYPYAITYAGDRVRGVRAGMWSWYDRLTPIARIGRSIYVFDVSEDDVKRLTATASAAPSPSR